MRLTENMKALLFALGLAISDVFNLGLLKALRTGQVKNMAWIAVPTIVYAFQPVIFFKGLAHTTLTALNLLWDVMSDVLVTLTGLYYFKERISMRKQMGAAFSILGIFLLGGDDCDEFSGPAAQIHK